MRACSEKYLIKKDYFAALSRFFANIPCSSMYTSCVGGRSRIFEYSNQHQHYKSSLMFLSLNIEFTMMTLLREVFSLKVFISANPSIWGIMISRRIYFGWNETAFVIPSRPSFAVSTWYHLSSNMILYISMSSTTSSMMRIFSALPEVNYSPHLPDQYDYFVEWFHPRQHQLFWCLHG